MKDESVEKGGRYFRPRGADPDGVTVAAVIAAGGSGSRMGAPVPKQLMGLAGKPVLIHSVEKILELPGVVQVVIALPPEHIPLVRGVVNESSPSVPILCVPGGTTRQESVRRGVGRSLRGADLILVHDAARPLCDRDLLERVIRAAWTAGGAVPGLPAMETIQRVSRFGRVLKTPPRGELYAIQTPQCFHAEKLRTALQRADREEFFGTDESSVLRWAGYRVVVVEGSPSNIKITNPQDLSAAERLFWERSGGDSVASFPRESRAGLRIGHGIDYHRLARGRKLFLGGVRISFEKGLAGHSDADVLCHAICDALLGAAALGDIGTHFPDTDSANRNRSSLEFLAIVRSKVEHAGWSIHNVDATLLVQRPRVSPHIDAMRRNVAGSLGLAVWDVSIKATTTEGLNAEGRGEGISAQAIALLGRKPEARVPERCRGKT